MSKVHAVLLVPEKGDPHELLREGPCGARPPMAVRRTYPRVVHESNEWGDPTYNGEKCEACGQPWPCETPGKVESEGHVRWQPGNRHTTVADALVLAWGGKPVREGCDRADWADVWKSAPHYPDRDTWATVYAIMGHPDDTHVTVDDLRRLCSESGTLVLIDADGKEVT